MNKITPYTAFCDIFRCKEEPNHENCRENNIENVTKHDNVASLQNFNPKKVPQVDNSCQTQPLRDYAMDKIMKAAKIKYSKAQLPQNSIIRDDNFQILHPDYAAYSGENFSGRNRFKTIAERPCTAHDERKESNNKPHQTIMTNLQQQDLFQGSAPYNPYKNKINETRFATTTNYPKPKYRTKYSPVKPTRQFHSGLKDLEVNALYRTVSKLKTAFADKYDHIHDEKCLCEHCGALEIIKESLKHPMICDHCDEDQEEEHHRRKKHRKHQSRRDKHDEKEYIKLMAKVKKMQDRLEDLESMNYVAGPFKQRQTIDTYTQCEKKQTRFAEPEVRRNSPRRFFQNGCPLSFMIPHNLKENIKEKILRCRSSDRKSSSGSDESSSNYSDYKFKPVKHSEKHKKSPKPKLRCHTYMSMQKEQPKKSSLKSSLKTYNVPAKENTEKNAITEKNMQDLLFKISNVRSRSPTSTLEADKVRIYLQSKQTGFLYQRNNTEFSSESCVPSDMKFMMEQSKNIDSTNKITELTDSSNQTYYNNYKSQTDCLLLEEPYFIEKLVRVVPEKNLDNFKPKTHKTSTDNETKPAVNPPNNIFLSNDTYIPSRIYHKMGTQQNELFNGVREMKTRHTGFYGNTSTDKSTFNSSAKKTFPDEVTTLVSTTKDTTDDPSFSQYSNYADKFSTEDSVYSNVIFKTSPAYNRSKSSSPSNIKHKYNTSINEKTRKKKSIVTINDKKVKFIKQNRENTTNRKVINFVELNKKMFGHSSKSKSSKRSPERSNEKSKNNTDDMLVNFWFNKKKVKSKEKEVNNRKKWNFSFLDIKTDSVKQEKIEKANKKQIIKKLSKLSSSSSSETDSTISIFNTYLEDIEEDSLATEATNDLIPDKKPGEKGSIFRLIKRYSNKLLPKRKPKPIPPAVKTFSGITKLKTKLKPVDKNVHRDNKKTEKDKTKNSTKRKSKIPVYIYLSKNRKSTKSPVRPVSFFLDTKETNDPMDALLKPEQNSSINKATNTKKSIKKLNKYCLMKPAMEDKNTVLSNETIFTQLASKIIAEYEEIKTAVGTEISTESMNTLLVNSAESIVEGQHNTSMNNIIFNSGQANCNTIPIISKQSSNSKLMNLSVETNVLDNMMPTFFWNKYPPDKLLEEVIVCPTEKTKYLTEINKYGWEQNTQKKINTVFETVTSYSIEPSEYRTNHLYGISGASKTTNFKDIKTSGALQSTQNIKKKIKPVCEKVISYSIEPNEKNTSIKYSNNKANGQTNLSGSLQNTENIKKKTNTVYEQVTSYSIEPNENSTNLNYVTSKAKNSTNLEEIKTSESLQNIQNIKKKINPVCEKVTSYSIEPNENSNHLNYVIIEARCSTIFDEIKTSGSLENAQNIKKKINLICEKVTAYSIEPKENSNNLNCVIIGARRSTKFDDIKTSGSSENTQNIKKKINQICEKVTSYSIEPNENSTNLNYITSESKNSTNLEEIKTSGSLQNTQNIKKKINPVCEKVTSCSIEPNKNSTNIINCISEASIQTNFDDIKTSESLQNIQNSENKINTFCEKVTSYSINPNDIYATFLYGITEANNFNDFKEIKKSQSVQNTQNIKKKSNEVCNKMTSYFIELKDISPDLLYGVNDVSSSSNFKEIQKSELLHNTQNITKKIIPVCEKVASYSIEPSKASKSTEIQKFGSLLNTQSITKKINLASEHMLSCCLEPNEEISQMYKSSLDSKKVNENSVIEINFLTKTKKEKSIKKKVSISSDLPSKKSSAEINKNKKTKSKQEEKKNREQRHPKIKKKRIIYESEGVTRKNRESLKEPSKVSKKGDKTKMDKKIDKKDSVQSITSSQCSCRSLPHVPGANSNVRKTIHSQLVGCKSTCKKCMELSQISSKTNMKYKCRSSPSNFSINTPPLKLMYGPGETPKQRKPKKRKLCNKCAQKNSCTELNCNSIESKLTPTPSKCSCSRPEIVYAPGETPKIRKLKQRPSKCSLECTKSSVLLAQVVKGKKKKNCKESPCSSKCKLIARKESISNHSDELSNHRFEKQSKQSKIYKKNCRSSTCPIEKNKPGAAERSPSWSKMSSIESNSSETCARKCKKMSTLQKMKNKIASTFKSDFLKNLYKRPTQSIALKQKNCTSNICEDCLKELDSLQQNASRKTSSTFVCSMSGKNKSSAVNVYNMQNFRLDSTDDTSRSNTDADSVKTIEEKLYLLQNFFFRMQYEGCTSDNEPLENS